MEPDLQTERVIREKLLEPSTETIHLHLQVEKLELGSGRVVPRVAVITSLSLYLFIEDPSYFLCEPQLTAAEKRSGRRDGIQLLKEDDKFRWNTMIEVDFLAGDQSVIALRFSTGATQLRFGDDFGLSIFKRELRRLLPQGINQWRRGFGYGDAADKDGEHEEGEESDEDDAKIGEDAVEGDENADQGNEEE